MAPIGGLLALLLTGTHFSVSSGVGFLALFGVSVQTGVIMLEYINQLRARGHTVVDAAIEGAEPPAFAHYDDHARGYARLVASGAVARDRFGFAAALCHRHRGRPCWGTAFECFSAANPYVWFAGDGDKLPEPEAGFEESA